MGKTTITTTVVNPKSSADELAAARQALEATIANPRSDVMDRLIGVETAVLALLRAHEATR